MITKKPLQILIIEDNPGDIILISEFLRDTCLDLNITVAEDGQKAMDILERANGSSTSATPDFVVLDLNLPKVHGYDVLAFIRGSSVLRRVPVVVLTGSLDPQDELRSRSMGVTDYRIKPSGRDEMAATRRWLKESLVPIVVKKLEEDRYEVSNTMMSTKVIKKCTNDWLAFRDHLPYDASCYGLGEWSFSQFGRGQ